MNVRSKKVLTILKKLYLKHGKHWIIPDQHGLTEKDFDQFDQFNSELFPDNRWIGRINHRSVLADGKYPPYGRQNVDESALHLEISLELERDYSICSECLVIIDKGELLKKQCVDCKGDLPRIVSRELREKYNLYCFGKVINSHGQYINLATRVSSTHAKLLYINTSVCAGGAWRYAGQIKLTDTEIIVKTHGAQRSRDAQIDTVAFDYAHPTCFEDLHAYLQQVTINHNKACKFEHDRCWVKFGREHL